MTGTIKRTTPNYALGIPYFDAPGWGSALERNLNIIDAVLGLVSAVPGVVGSWDNNTDYVVGDRVVDTDDDTVWVCNVGHTSASTGTFDDDRTAHPTYWTVVTREIVVRGEVVEGDAYYVGDFVYSEDERIGGVVVNAFTATANLVDNINDLSLIYDLRAYVLPTVTTAGSYLKRNAGNTAYEEKTATEVGADVASGVADTLGIPAAVADTYLRRNAGNTAYETKTSAQVLADIGGIGGTAGTTDNRLVRSDGTDGKTLQSTGITVDDDNNISGLGTVSSIGSAVNRLTIGSTGANTSARGILLTDSAGASAGIIEAIPNTVGTNTQMDFYVGGAAAGDRKFSLHDDGHAYLVGGQLKFPSTQNPSTDPNTLDDYEEGTYTPIIYGSTAAGSGTYSVQSGYYTKIGNCVMFDFDCTWSAHTGTGLLCANLPIATAINYQTPVTVMYQQITTITTGYFMGLQIVGVNNQIQSFMRQGGNGNNTTLNMSATGLLRGSGHYYV